MFPDGGVAAGVKKSTGAVESLTVAIKVTLLSNKFFLSSLAIRIFFRVLKHLICHSSKKERESRTRSKKIIKAQRFTWRRDEQLRGRSSHGYERRCYGGRRRCARYLGFPHAGIHHVYVIGTHTPALWQFVHIAITGGQFQSGIHRRCIFAVRWKRLGRCTAFHHHGGSKTDIGRLRRWHQRCGTVVVLIFIHPLLSNWVPHNL